MDITMQVGGIIGKGGLTPMWYIRFGVVAGCDWAKKRKTEPRGLGFWFLASNSPPFTRHWIAQTQDPIPSLPYPN